MRTELIGRKGYILIISAIELYLFLLSVTAVNNTGRKIENHRKQDVLI